MDILQTSDRPSVGAYLEHEVMEVFKPAMYASLLFNLAGKRSIPSGDSLTIPAYQNLDRPASTQIGELEPLPVSKLTLSAKKISPKEHGRAIVVSEKLVRRNPFDILMANKEVLAEDISRELEAEVANALREMPIKYVATGATSQTITTNGTAGAAATVNPNIYHMQYIGNYMSDDLRIPMDPRFGSYVAVFRGNGLLGIQRDPEFFELSQGQGLGAVDSLKIGKIADITFFKHNDSGVLDNALAVANNVSEGFIMGKEAVLFAFLSQIKMVHDFSDDKAYNDFGRRKYIAWKGDYAAGLYSDSANADLVRGIHWTSNV